MDSNQETCLSVNLPYERDVGSSGNIRVVNQFEILLRIFSVTDCLDAFIKSVMTTDTSWLKYK